jgi:hypothetical protein
MILVKSILEASLPHLLGGYVNRIVLGSLGKSNIYQQIITAAEDRETVVLILTNRSPNKSCVNPQTMVVLILKQRLLLYTWDATVVSNYRQLHLLNSTK